MWSLFLFNEVTAQYDQSSYSIIGVGNPNWGGYSHNASMGGLGISNSSRYFLNNLNPALGASNLEAVFQTGASFDIRNFGQGQNSYSSVAGGIKDFGFNLPVKYGKWNLGISLNPYTIVNYGFTDRREGAGPDGSTTITEVEGRGGIDELAITNAFRIKNFQLGIKASFLFGSIQRENLFFLEGVRQTGFGNSVVNERKSFHRLSLGLGGLYKIPLSERTRINIGAFFNPEINLRQNLLRTFENQTQAGTTFRTDTLVFDEAAKKTIAIPQKFGFGISYEKLQRLTLGIDFLSQNWADYRDEDGVADAAYGKSYRIVFGGNFIPDYNSQKRISLTTYRFGVHYEQTPYLVNNGTINDIGISLGASVPLNAFWGQGNINIGTTFGRRGNASNGLVRENYFKIHLGFSVQDLTWFTRRRFN